MIMGLVWAALQDIGRHELYGLIGTSCGSFGQKKACYWFLNRE